MRTLVYLVRLVLFNMTYGPDGSVYILDWTDKTACHFFGPEAYDRTNGRIFKVSHGKGGPPPGDLATRTSAELVRLQLHPNDWYVRHARRLLQERGPDPEVHRALAAILADHAEEPRRLRALWALHATGGLTESIARTALEQGSEFVRAWTVQLIGEEGRLSSGLKTLLAGMAAKDPSPVVRLYLASLLQRLPPDDRWEIGAALMSRAEDARDPAVPLMVWYGVEPLDGVDGRRALSLAASAKLPLVREFMARRHVETRDSFEDLAGMLTEPSSRRDFLRGMREGLKGRAGLRAPSGGTVWRATIRRSGRCSATSAPRWATRARPRTFGRSSGTPPRTARRGLGRWKPCWARGTRVWLRSSGRSCATRRSAVRR